jgi:hypothetical protein
MPRPMSRPMPRPKTLFALVALCSFSILAHAQDSSSQQQSFVSGGDIHFDLSAGDYDFTASTDNTIRVSWRWDNDRGSRHTVAPHVNAQIKVSGQSATVTTEGRHNNIHYTVEVPKSSNLNVRLSAGDIRIADIDGSKDVHMHAGDVRIAVGDPQKYAQVDLSVKAGDLNAQPFGGTKDGLFRSFHWTGKGSYRLQVHLGAGDVNLVTSDSI